MDTLQYNTKRKQLVIPEYGRHIHIMIEQAKLETNPEERNKKAKAIIGVMGNLNPHLRDVADFQHKLWDQLYIMSDFKLDADSPYEKPSKEELQEKPERLPYPKSANKYRFYGNNIQIMIDTVLTWENGEMKDALIYTIANHMKKCFLNWNKDTVKDDVIFSHLYELSDCKIDIRNSEEILSESKSLLRKRNTQGQGGSNHKNKSKTHQHKNRKR